MKMGVAGLQRMREVRRALSLVRRYNYSCGVDAVGQKQVRCERQDNGRGEMIGIARREKCLQWDNSQMFQVGRETGATGLIPVKRA